MRHFVIILLLLGSCSKKESIHEQSNNFSNENKKQRGCGAEAFFEEYEKWLLETYPLYASRKNEGSRHNTFFENTEENIKKIYLKTKEKLSKVEALLKKKKCETQSLNLNLLHGILSQELEEYEFKTHYIQFQSMGGPHTWLPQMHNRVPLKTTLNYEDYLERMAKIPEVFSQAKAMSLKGAELGITPPQVTFKDYESTFLDIANSPPEQNPFYTPFIELPADFSQSEAEGLRAKAKKIILEKIKPAYLDLHKFWVKDYYPKLRKTIAAKDLPNGEAYYNFAIKKMTTLNKTASEVHEIGLAEVERILTEMKAIKNKVKFSGSLKEFFEELRTNPKYYAKTTEELFAKNAVILKTIDGKLPMLFKKLPMLSYGVEPVPDYIADKSPAAYYIPGDMNNGKSGTYQINLSNLKSRPLYNLTALALHEAVPGHHLQIALAQELEGLPEFRKSNGLDAFVEGWGLYAESLGKDVGMYSDPIDDFGRLTYEQWRAMRLVVDTGIHAKGWSRKKAIDYMKDNSGLSEKNITTEVDRYINWPAQALSYKMGELKIKELRAYAKRNLERKFDIRDFHDVVLKEGAIPLPLLEKNVKNYVSKKLNRKI